ncbi:MAG: competence/damage-inducible protein A [Bacteroidetes bacterium]|nr:competence/damage-inducible protein A [Bacteroidota bacterium]
MKITAEIITIGDEILIGQIVNTNAVWLSQQLVKIGVWVSKIASVGDNSTHISYSLKQALLSNNIVIITGGLGPTNDDITKKTLQDFFKTGLKKVDEVENHIKSTFKKVNVEFLPVHEQQSYILGNSSLLFNNYGTAPGMWIDENEKTVIILPGVPKEMKGIMSDFALDKIKLKYKLPEIISKSIVTYGIPESTLAEILKETENQLPDNIKLAYLPSFSSVKLRLTSVSYDLNFINTVFENCFKEILQKIPTANIAAIQDLKQEEIIGKLLSDKGKTLSIAESCTGGYVSHLITSVSGSSQYFKGSVTSYSNSAKINILEVEQSTIDNFGAVSEQCVRQMAKGVRKKFDSDYAISTSGIAGPTGETPDKPIGTVWIAVCNRDKCLTKKIKLKGNREDIIKNSSFTALEFLRQLIISE